MPEIHNAVKTRDVEHVRHLVGAGEDLSAWDHDGKSAMVLACEAGDYEIAGILLDAGADTMGDKCHRVPLIITTVRGDDRMVHLLLAHRASPSEPDDRAWTALHHACVLGRASIARALFAAGARVAVRNGRGRSPAVEAAWAGHDDIVQILWPSVTRHDRERTEAIRLFIERDGRPDPVLLYDVAIAGDQGLLDQLIAAGADINVTYEGSPAIVTAATCRHTEMVRHMVDLGADPDMQDKDGSTALLVAVAHANLDLVRYLWPICSEATRSACRPHIRKAMSLWPDWAAIDLEGL